MSAAADCMEMFILLFKTLSALACVIWMLLLDVNRQ